MKSLMPSYMLRGPKPDPLRFLLQIVFLLFLAFLCQIVICVVDEFLGTQVTLDAGLCNKLDFANAQEETTRLCTAMNEEIYDRPFYRNVNVKDSAVKNVNKNTAEEYSDQTNKGDTKTETIGSPNVLMNVEEARDAEKTRREKAYVAKRQADEQKDGFMMYTRFIAMIIGASLQLWLGYCWHAKQMAETKTRLHGLRSQISLVAQNAWKEASQGSEAQKVADLVNKGLEICAGVPELENDAADLKVITAVADRIRKRSADPREWSREDVVDFLRCETQNSRLTPACLNGNHLVQHMELMMTVWTQSTYIPFLRGLISSIEGQINAIEQKLQEKVKAEHSFKEECLQDLRSQISKIAQSAWKEASQGSEAQKVADLVNKGLEICAGVPELENDAADLKVITAAADRIRKRSADPREWSREDVVDFLRCETQNSRLTPACLDGKHLVQHMELMMTVWTQSTDIPFLKRLISAIEEKVFEVDILKGEFKGLSERVIKESDVSFGKHFASGGFADVYHAEWRERKVAIKVLKAFSGQRSEIEELLRELEATRKVAASDFVVTCHGIMLGKRCGIVLDEEMCNLHTVIEHGFLGDIRYRLRLLLDIARGLKGIHNADLIHGDIKPSNLLMSSSGRIKIADFGSSKASITLQTRTSCAHGASQVGGTYQYMGPEVWKNSKCQASDIWAFGLIIWNVVTGEINPWGKLDSHQVMFHVVNQSFIPDLVNIKEYPSEIAQLYRDCCAFDLRRRPDAARIIATLEAMLDHIRKDDDLPWMVESGKDRYDVAVMDIAADSSEYSDVVNAFRLTCPCPVIKVQKIQNAEQWNLFAAKERAMCSKNTTSGAAKKQLFHGTDPKTVHLIAQRSFNRSYCGVNGTVYGQGTYFATDASYSANTKYSPPDPQGLRYMFLARVLVGENAVGKSNMKAPPYMPDQGNRQYDSTCDNLSNPSIFVVYHDAQAYPEYLITFR